MYLFISIENKIKTQRLFETCSYFEKQNLNFFHVNTLMPMPITQ